MPSRTGLITLSGAPSQMLPLTRANHACRWQPAHAHTPQHRTRNPCQVSHAHGLASSAIARHYTRNHNCFLLLRVLRCFTSPRQPPHRLCIHLRVTPHNRCWVSPFGHPRINAQLTTPRGLTQPFTSFIGSACQGIHHTPVTKHTDTQTIKVNNTKTQKRKILASTIQFSHNTTPTQTKRQQPPPAHEKGPNKDTQQTCAAPDTQQCTNALHLLSRAGRVSPTQHHTANTHHLAVHHMITEDHAPTTTRCASTRQNIFHGSRSLGDINHTKTSPQL